MCIITKIYAVAEFGRFFIQNTLSIIKYSIDLISEKNTILAVYLISRLIEISLLAHNEKTSRDKRALSPRIDLEMELITRTVMLTPAETREVGYGIGGTGAGFQFEQFGTLFARTFLSRTLQVQRIYVTPPIIGD